jgi:NAD(P)-dependent dehydrogenase (short-subunit alcohol dehydrogenase family)
MVKSGGRAIAPKGDIAVETDVLGMFDAATKALGPFSVVIANAGIVAPSEAYGDERRVDAAFVRGQCARRLSHRPRGNAANVEVLRRGGRINRRDVIGRGASRLAEPLCRLCRVQGAIDTLTLGLATELGPEGVRVNAIRPGLIDTDIHASSRTAHAFCAPPRPMGRPGTAEKIAEAAVWLISDAASYATGALLHVAGGR